MRHVLIVDDALDLGRMLKTALSVLDPTMAVVVVPSAEEALLEGHRYPLDLLVADINLPGISGIELVSKIRLKHPDVKVIVITGLTDEDVIKEARELEADAFFRKPLRISEFIDAVSSCLGLSVPESELDFDIGGISPETDIPSSDQLADILTGLRQSLGAHAVLLIDDRGKITAQAGDLSPPFDMDWIPHLLSATSTCVNISRLLGQTRPENTLAFRGRSTNLVMASVGSFALAVVMKKGSSNLRLALAFEEILNVQNELALVLLKMGLNLYFASEKGMAVEEFTFPGSIEKTGQEIDAPEEDLDLTEFEGLFQQPEETFEKKDADTYWDSAFEESRSVETRDPDMISFEQAQQLGLTPKDSEVED